jgi:hypothetical protein
MKAVLEHNLRNGLSFDVADTRAGMAAILGAGTTPSAALSAGVFSGGKGRQDCAGTVRTFAWVKGAFRYVGKPIKVG